MSKQLVTIKKIFNFLLIDHLCPLLMLVFHCQNTYKHSMTISFSDRQPHTTTVLSSFTYSSSGRKLLVRDRYNATTTQTTQKSKGSGDNLSLSILKIIGLYVNIPFYEINKSY